MIRCDKITNWVFLILNAIPPILSGLGYIGYYSAGANGNMEMSDIFLQLGNIFGLFTLFTPIISGIYLFIALYKINKSVRNQDDLQVNLKAMALHATSFGFFMASVLLFMIADVMAR